MERTYIIARESPVRKDRVIRERTEDHNQEVLSLPKGLPPEVYSDVLDALRRTYQDGREDCSSELLPHDGPDVLRTVLASHALGMIAQWAPGYTDAIGDVQQYRVTLEGLDEANCTAKLGIGTAPGNVLKTFRVRLLVEEVRKP